MESLNAVQQSLREDFPRYVAGGIDPNDFERLLPLVDSWDRWMDLMRQLGDERVQLAEQAVKEGHRLTAEEAFVQASIYYHFGQLSYFENDVRKHQMRDLSVKTFQRGSGWIDPPVKRLEIPFKGIRLVGNLRVPKGSQKPGCIFLLPGVDSTKEEMHTFERYFLDRGVATLAFEGPGQGEVVDFLAMNDDDYERALSVTIDFMEKEVNQINATRLAVYGRSMGGYLAPRVAAFETRIKAVISAGGIYDMSYWDNLPVGTKHCFRYAWRCKTLEDAAQRASRVSLEGIVQKIQCPFLILHSGQDTHFPAEGARRMAQEARCPTQLVIYEEGTHVCDNITYKYRPLVADWTADQLSRVR